MKTAKRLLVIIGFFAGFAALALHFYNPLRDPDWRLERVSANKRAIVHILNLTKIASGSGVVISDAGTILTAAHVAMPGDKIFAVTFDRRGQPVLHLAVVGIWDKDSQLSILFTKGRLPPPVRVGRSAPLRAGNLLYTIGFPGSFSQPMVDAGIIAQRYFMAPREPRMHSILVRITPVPGMSGSPVFNQQGELVGIIDAILGQQTVGGHQFWAIVNSTDPLPGIIRKWLAVNGQPTNGL